MSKQIKIEPKVSRLIHFMDMIRKGQVKIPSFQRDFVWSNKQKIELFESIELEYPIGSILLWKPEQRFKINHELGPFIIEKISPNGFFYILDGFQRLSTLFGCLTNPNLKEFKTINDKLNDFRMYYDLDKQEFNIPRSRFTHDSNLPIHTLFDTFGFLDYSDELRNKLNNKEKANKFIARGKKLSSILIDYQLPYVEIHGGTIEQAVNIFSRINSKGLPISPDWMISALTTNEEEGFNLGDIIEELLNDLEAYNFHDLKREIILHCIQTSFGKLYIDSKIEDLIKQKKKFKEKVFQTVESVKKSVRFLFEELLVLERKLLPYNNQLVFLSYFFYKVDNPTSKQRKTLKEWFWKTTYASYFTIYPLSKIRISFEYFKEFVEGKRENPVYNDRPATNDRPEIPFSATEFPTKNISFKSVRSTALVLFLLNYSNSFKPIDADKVKGLELQYLMSGGRIPENIIPLIKHIDNKLDVVQIKGKPKNLSSMLEHTLFYQKQNGKYFIDEHMSNLKRDKVKVLERRKFLIKNEERKFVSQLEIEY